MFPQAIAVPARGISIGLAEMLIFFAYVLWFSQVFIVRSRPFPRFNKLDIVIVSLLFTQVVSLIGAPNKALAAFDVFYNIKFSLIYFFLANRLGRRHLPLIIVLIIFSIYFEGGLALYERFSGHVGIGTSKGNVQSVNFGTQGSVPGVEDEIRSAGTTLDPHALGLYLSMVLPVPLVFLMSKYFKPSMRLLLFGALLVGAAGLLVTFSRSGWLSCAIGSVLAIGFILFRWEQGNVLILLMAFWVAVLPFSPKMYEIIDKKLMNAPVELISVRVDLAKTALNIWGNHILFGYGPGNYLEAIDDPDTINYGHIGNMAERPVHNAYLWTAAEIGALGLVTFFGMIVIGCRQCYTFLRSRDLLVQGIALAVFIGLVDYLLDGISNMMFREVTPYGQLWLYLALSRAMPSMQKVDCHALVGQ